MFFFRIHLHEKGSKGLKTLTWINYGLDRKMLSQNKHFEYPSPHSDMRTRATALQTSATFFCVRPSYGVQPSAFTAVALAPWSIKY